MKKPRILIVTPEITYLPQGMGNLANLSAKAGGLADVSAALVGALFELGADVHLAIPDYRSMFHENNLAPLIKKESNAIKNKMPEGRIHLAEDRVFFYMNRVYSNYNHDNVKIALAYQREVINNIVPRVKPDLIHCNDWMTGLVPAMSRKMGIPCLFTVHNIYTVKALLAEVEDRGIDAAYFWQQLFFENMSTSYEETRENNSVDFLLSGIFAAHFVNTVSPSFLNEIIQGRHDFAPPYLQRELANKVNAGCAAGILNAPDPGLNPTKDIHLSKNYSPKTHASGKKANKRFLQKALGLVRDEKAPVFFWASRMDTIQKGCSLLAEILYKVVSKYWNKNLEIVFVANGEFRRHFKDIVFFHNLEKRVAICDFSEDLASLAYSASDFILMPSRFEPCGLPQMIGPIYGSLPIGHDTGGIHDTITSLDVSNSTGNGFLFNVFDSNGLFWAIDQAMIFYDLSARTKAAQIKRIMEEALKRFNHENTASQYIDLYEKMLRRPLVN